MPSATESDEIVESSTTGEVDVNKEAVSSTAEEGKSAAASKVTKTLEDVVQSVFKSQSSGEKEEAESGVQSLNKTSEKKEGEETKEEEVDASESQDKKGEKVEEEKKKEEDKGPIPYARFEEVNKVKVELEQQFEQLKPLLEAQQSVIDHCTKHNISEQQFYYWMDVAAMVNSDPAKAMETLKPILGQLQGFSGDILPQDLQELVDNNEIPLAVAKRLVAAESREKFGQGKAKMTEQQMQAQRHQQFVSELTNSMNSWLGSQKTSDPDFQPKKGESEPDGKFEFFLHKFKAEAEVVKPKNAQELVALADKVKTSLGSAFERMFPKAKATRTIHSSRSTTSGNGAPKTLEEAIEQQAAKNGIAFTAPKRK